MNAEDFMEEMLNRIKALSKDINEKETRCPFCNVLGVSKIDYSKKTDWDASKMYVFHGCVGKLKTLECYKCNNAW